MFADFEEANWKLNFSWRKTKATYNIKGQIITPTISFVNDF
jgi:hypothetical protein